MLDNFGIKERIKELNDSLRAINQDIMNTILVEDRGETKYCDSLREKAESIDLEINRIENALKMFKTELKDFVQNDEEGEKKG